MKKNNKEILELEIESTKLRKQILQMIVAAEGTHIGSAFSIIDILTVLYDKILNINPKNPDDPNRDKFVLSKGHGAAALYVVLAKHGFFSEELLKTYCLPGSILGGHPDSKRVPGVETSTGSLGHGFSVAAGFALANKINKNPAKVYCLIGDGEANEGSIWEATEVAAHHKLDNLTLILDDNKLMIGGFTKDIIDPISFRDKFIAFGWNTIEIDGHDFRQMLEVFTKVPIKNGKPTVIIANTIKGKGVQFMENEKEWHSMLPNENQMKDALRELDDKIKLVQNKLK